MQRKTIEKWAIALTALTACATPDEPTNDVPTGEASHVEVAADGIPYHVRGSFGRVKEQVTTVAEASALDGVLPGIAAAFRLSSSDLVATRVQRDEIGMTHVRYEQRKNGLRVIGGDLVVHLDPDGRVRSVNSTARDVQNLSANPSLSAARGGELARNAVANGDADAGPSNLVYVIDGNHDMFLAWETEVRARRDLVRDLVYVDAHNGNVVYRRPQIQTAKNRSVLDGEGGIFPIFYSMTQVGTESSPPTGDAIATAAYNNTGYTHDCLQTLFSRDSYDGAGGVLQSLIHVSFFTGTGTTPNNAAWDGTQMIYGDGDNQVFTPLANALDVTAHELGHGVTSSTANLTYMNESGALNEGMSDIIAAICESHKAGSISAKTWLVGEDIFTPNTANDALRYMDNPTKDKDMYPPALGGSRDFYADRYTGSEDSGGVHLNSGIPNLAFYLSVAGGKHPRNRTTFMVPSIGMEKAAKIYFRALTMGNFTANTNLTQARTELEEVANQLYPGTSGAVGTAWAAVGIGTPPDPDTVPPTVEITAPADGATVADGFTVEATAADDKGVLRVEFSIDGTVAGSDDTAPYSFVTATGLAPGDHTVQATAYDNFNSTSDSITVTIPNIDPEPDPDPNPDPNNPGDDDGDGGGCCSTSTDEGAIGSLLLFLATMLSLRRRRR